MAVPLRLSVGSYFHRTQQTPMLWRCRDRVLSTAERCLIMGIVNVTPDSFSDGGQFYDTTAAVEHALQLAADGADILDVGGESSRPGAEPVSEAEELRRVVPVVAALARRTTLPISVDTTKAEVAKQCLDAGAIIINDISGLLFDARMPQVVRDSGCGAAVMHMQGTPATMSLNPHYTDVVAEVGDFFHERLRTLTDFGIHSEQLAFDPGIGFGKNLEHNLLLIKHADRFLDLGRPLLLGVSRKGFIGQITDRPRHERAVGSVAVVAYGIAHKTVHIVRVHDVAATRDLVRIMAAIHSVSEERQ